MAGHSAPTELSETKTKTISTKMPCLRHSKQVLVNFTPSPLQPFTPHPSSLKMSPIKIYQNVNSKEESLHFGISRMEATYAKRGGQADAPHRHNYYTVLIIEQATGLHKIDFNTYALGEKQVFFVAPGQVHQVMETAPSVGFAMTFSTTFLVENAIPLAFVNSLNLFQNYGNSPPLLPAEAQFRVLKAFAARIWELQQGHAPMKYLSIGAYLKLLLIECNAICAINPIETEGEPAGNTVLRAFKEAVDAHYKEEHSTRFYAAALHLTPDHLNRIVKATIGTTAKEYIQSRIVTEAKRLLYFTDLSAKEVGYDLGFSEPANFSAFFKKHTQLAPSDFKKSEG